MPVSDQTVMEDKNYIGVAQLYTLMKKVNSNNRMASEKLLQVCDDLDNLHRMINDIVEQGIDINYRVRASDFFKMKMPHMIGSTVLHLAAEKDDIDMFDYFIKKGADFTVKNSNQVSVVHQMIYKSDYKKYFDSVTFEGKLEQDPFVESVLSAHIQYNNPSNPCDRNGMSHFSVACMTNNVKSVEFFLKHGVSVNGTYKENSSIPTGYDTPLHFAARYCAVEVAEILLNHGADLTAKNSKGMTALQVLVEEKMKIWSKRTRLMSMDLSEKPETYTNLISLLEKNEKIMKMMLDSYRDDEENNTADIDFTRFYAVCTMQDTSMVEHFLNNKVISFDQAIDFDSPFCPGYTALHFSAHFNANTVKLLVKTGVSMIVKDAKGITPFDICIRTFKVEDIYSIMLLRDVWSNITFLNGKTKLLDFIYSMQAPNLFEDYLRNKVASMYTYVNLDSPICAGYTPLHLAVICTETCPSNWTDRVIRMPRYLARITTCLSLGADVTAENADGLTSVHQAFRLCENEMVAHLLHWQRRSFNPVDNSGLSHFHVACIVNCKDLIEKLIDSGIDVNSSITSDFSWYKENSCCESFIPSGSTPLHLVADIGDLEMVKLMIKHNANVFAKDANRLTAIDRAVEAKRFEENICSYSKTVGLYERVIDLLRKIAINKATTNNVTSDYDILYEILHRIPLDNYSLGLFVKHDNKHYRKIIVHEAMLECVFKKMGITMLHLACYKNSYEQILEQLDNGADVNARVNEDSPFYPGYTPLHFAVFYQLLRMIDSEYICTDIVDLLLERGADVTIANCKRRTPIHQAFDWFSCKEYPPDIISGALLKGHKDFRINPVDNNGISHFHVACFRNAKNIVNEFINKGVNVNQTVDHFRENFGGYTPLHFAMISPSKKTYSLLLKHGANVNAKDRLGNTPLHVAVSCSKWSNDQVFSSVLRAGADPNAKNIMHVTPLEMLIDKEEITRKAVAHFIRHGAYINIINPISREGYLSQAIELLNWDESIFHELVKSQDVMNVDKNGSTAMHNIVSIDAVHNWTYTSSDVIEKGNFPTHAEAIEILTNLNLDIDSQDKKGMSALHLAVKNRNVEGIVGLLLNGADINAIDTSGNTPFTYSWEAYNQSIATSSDKLKSFEFKIFRILTMHVHKLLFAKIYVSKANHDMYVEARKKFYVDDIKIYNAELQELEKRQIGSTSISLRYFLSETGVVGSYPHIMQPQRQEIDEFFKNSVKSLQKQFPTMTSLLKLQYRKALVRADLVSSAAESLNLLLGLDLPVLCSDPLMRFLTNQDLKNVIATVNVM